MIALAIVASVAIVCATALRGFVLFLRSRPGCTEDEFKAMRAELGEVRKLAINAEAWAKRKNPL